MANTNLLMLFSMENYKGILALGFISGMSVVAEAATSVLDWSNHDNVPGGWIDGAPSAAITVDNVTFNMGVSGDLEFQDPTTPEVTFNTGSYSWGNPSAEHSLLLDMDWDDINDSITFTATFTSSLSDFSFSIIDIDSRVTSNGPGSYYSIFRDTVTVRGFGASGDVYATITSDPLVGAAHFSISGVNGNTMVATDEAILPGPGLSSLDDPQATLTFSEPITGFEIIYGNTQFDRQTLINNGFQTDDPFTDPVFTNPAAQFIRIGDFSWTSVPEPSSALLFGFGLSVFCFLRKRESPTQPAP